MAIPNLFIAGFQKCATSTLFWSLAQHPSVGIARDRDNSLRHFGPKEPHFYSGNFHRGMAWYQRLYEHCDEPVRLDGSPSYLSRTDSIERLVAKVPDAKMILSIREPVSRACSAWNHWQDIPAEERWGVLRPEGTFAQNVRAELKRGLMPRHHGHLVCTGYYFEQIEKLLRYVSREQICLTSQEALYRDFQGELAKIQAFVGIEPIRFETLAVNRRVRDAGLFESSTLALLHEAYQPHNDRLREFLGESLPWD